jgi:gamma-glutamyl:cysteine ligase YbdK (ATP-grasp superfamily)
MHDFCFGMEEEYFVVDRRTGSIKFNLPKEFMRGAKKKLGPNLMYELLQSQIEVATDPVNSSADARAQLHHFRTTLAELGRLIRLHFRTSSGLRERNATQRSSKTLEWLASRTPFAASMSM